MSASDQTRTQGGGGGWGWGLECASRDETHTSNRMTAVLRSDDAFRYSGRLRPGAGWSMSILQAREGQWGGFRWIRFWNWTRWLRCTVVVEIDAQCD